MNHVRAFVFSKRGFEGECQEFDPNDQRNHQINVRFLAVLEGVSEVVIPEDSGFCYMVDVEGVGFDFANHCAGGVVLVLRRAPKEISNYLMPPPEGAPKNTRPPDHSDSVNCHGNFLQIEKIADPAEIKRQTTELILKTIREFWTIMKAVSDNELSLFNQHS